MPRVYLPRQHHVGRGAVLLYPGSGSQVELGHELAVEAYKAEKAPQMRTNMVKKKKQESFQFIKPRRRKHSKNK